MCYTTILGFIYKYIHVYVWYIISLVFIMWKNVLMDLDVDIDVGEYSTICDIQLAYITLLVFFFKLSKTSHQLFQFIRIGLYWFTGENLQETIAVTLRDFLQDIPETTGVIAASGQPGVEGRLLLRPDGVPGTPWGVSRATWQRGMGVLFVKWNGIGQLDHVES